MLPTSRHRGGTQQPATLATLLSQAEIGPTAERRLAWLPPIRQLMHHVPTVTLVPFKQAEQAGLCVVFQVVHGTTFEFVGSTIFSVICYGVGTEAGDCPNDAGVTAVLPWIAGFRCRNTRCASRAYNHA